jgi:galactokinase
VTAVVARAPGRVNIIGDHTDYTGGLCLPMAIDVGVTIEGRPTVGGVIRLTSDTEREPALVRLDVTEAANFDPPWARYVAGVVTQVRPANGFEGAVHTTLPAGVGLSSSAALEVAVALAIGADDSDRVALARLCQAAEHAARGVPTGILDQVASLCGREGHAMLLDCHTVTVTQVPLPPPDVAEWVVLTPTGSRDLATSGYSERVAELALAAEEIGPLHVAELADVAGISDPIVRRRARHVVTENELVRRFASVIAADDLDAAGALMNESHRSLRDDFESSTPAIDELCADLGSTDGVFGARITGGGWGGSVIALTRPGVLAGRPGARIVRPSGGASR